MKCPVFSIAFLTLTASWMLSAGERTAPLANAVKLNGHVFTLPAGFDIELAAASPLINRPITADFDEQGRLYVADSSGSNDRVDVQLKTKPHRIVRLEATSRDGKYDRATVFADKLPFPEGTMWRGGSLYVAAVPSIWKLTDTDGDGVADQRIEWFNGKTMTGCANDLHGPYRGPDGWIYWCKGAFAKQTYNRPGKAPFSTRAAHIFRARPDGSGLEPVMTGGMDNPVDLAFTPSGERIFTTTFFQFPGGGRRDGLVHAVYGGVYGKDWDVIHEPAHRWTGPAVMPVLTHLGPAAPSGLTRYESRVFGPEYQDNLFAALFNLQKVTRHVLEPDGATFKTHDSDFVTSDNKDFHPTDVLEDADGSLLIVDTGGWYKLCCPTSQLVKPDVLGAIYRVRRKGATALSDSRGLKLEWAKLDAVALAGLLNDARPAVRQRALDVLTERGTHALAALAEALQHPSAERRRNAVWCATRIDDRAARALVRQALADQDAVVRQAALHSVSLWRDRAATTVLVGLLTHGPEQNRRGAAEALGRIGDRRGVPALLAAAGQAADRFVEHSLTYALIEIGDSAETAKGLQSSNARTRRAGLIALDQMENSALTAETVVGELAAADKHLREAAWWVAGRHPEWGAVLSATLRARLQKPDVTAGEREDLAVQLARLASSAAIQTLLADQLMDEAATSDSRRLALDAMARCTLKDTPAKWLAGLEHALQAGDAELARAAVKATRSLRLPKQIPGPLVEALRKAGNNPAFANSTRVAALAAWPAGNAAMDPASFAFLREQLRADESGVDRALATQALAQAKLSDAQLMQLVDAIKTAGPMELPRLVEAFGQSNDEKVGRALVTALLKAPARSALRVETLRPILAKYGPDTVKRGEVIMASLNADLGKQKARLENLLAVFPKGNVRDGQVVFNNPKIACVSCHAIGYLGGNVGPDLTRIGSIRTERDLLESILFPSSSFVRGYEPIMVTTRDGKVYNGVLRKDAAEEMVLVTGPNQETRIPREEVDEILPGRVSIMPAGLDQQLSTQQLADLVAFLRACR